MKYVQTETNRHGKVVRYFRRGSHPRVRLYSEPGSETFIVEYEMAMKDTPVPHVRDMPTLSQVQRQRTERYFKRFLSRARTMCRQRDLPFDLDMDWALTTAEAQDFRCCMTGIQFFAGHSASSVVHPYSPSVDRIKPGQGYTRDNVRLVIFALNAMLLDWGTEVFEQVANSYRYTKNRTRYSRTSFLQPEP